MNDAPQPAWRTSLDVEGQAEGHYPDHVNAGLFEVFAFPPREVLELGCASGAFGEELKRRHPGARVTGIEAGRIPADRASRRLDRVVCARLEALDLASLGLAPGSIDTVVAADVLEHVVNPWAILERLHPWLAPGAQVIASIPNVRNALLIAALAVNGRWEYRERGLLDVTHLRFFTLAEIGRMFGETGYRMETWSGNLSPPLEALYRANASLPSVTLRLGPLTLADLAPDAFRELCVEQFLVRARPAKA